MSQSPRQLGAIQRWMQSVITHPDGVVEGIESEPAQREINVDAERIEDVIRPSRSLSSIERLSVYGNAYVARLLECLREEFPALVQAIGEEAFDGLAFSYLQSCPSESYTLGQLGGRFPSYLEETRPDREAESPTWTDFLVDLAVLERTYWEVFDGPGPEGKRLLQMEDIEAVALDRWPEAKLVTPDWLQLRTFQFPVHEYASAVRVRGEAPPPPDPALTFLAITRREFVVRRTPLSGPQFALLGALDDGANIADALARATESEHFDGDFDTLTSEVRHWFHDWAAAGFFQAIALPDA